MEPRVLVGRHEGPREGESVGGNAGAVEGDERRGGSAVPPGAQWAAINVRNRKVEGTETSRDRWRPKEEGTTQDEVPPCFLRILDRETERKRTRKSWKDQANYFSYFGPF
jgi:hypothetical protein